MKNLATTLLLASLLTAPAVDAASIHAPAAVQSPVVVVLVDLEDDVATLHLDVPGIGNATVSNATGNGGIELPGVPNGVHAWTLRVTYADGSTESHAGAVSVLDVAAIVRSAIQGAAIASGDAATQAAAAATAAQAAAQAAESARVAAEALPDDVAQSSDLAALATKADLTAYRDEEATHRAEAQAADAEARAHVQASVNDLDESVGYLLFVVLLGTALVAWYLWHIQRTTPTDQDRALLQAVAVRLGIDHEAPEYVQALHDLDVQQRHQGAAARLMSRLRRPRPATPEDVEGVAS